MTLPAFADDPQAGADAQLGEDGKWYTKAHDWLYYASTQAPGSVPLDIASINAANAAYEAAAQAGLDGAPDYAQKVAAANTANNVMIKANGWSYAPAPQPDTTTLPTVTVGANARDFADGPAPTEDDAGPNRSGDAAPFADAPGPALNGEPGLNGANANYPDRSPGERGSDAPTAGTPLPPTPSNPDANEAPSTLARINGKISGFNDLVKDDLVEQGAQADRDGNRAAFVWNGIQYAIYNTVMPNSVQEAVIDTVGGPIIGKSLGWLGKIATHVWPGLGKGIGELAGGIIATTRRGWQEIRISADTVVERGGATENVVSNSEFIVAKHGEMPSPRPGQQSHHGVMSAWLKKNFPAYDPNLAPAILMSESRHRMTFGVYNIWRASMRNKLGGIFDWTKISEKDMRILSEKLFDAAGVPLSIRQQYWNHYEQMKGALTNGRR